MNKYSTLSLAVAGLLSIRADAATTIEELQNKLIRLTEEANTIQARADAENRPLSTQEQADVDSIFDSFEETKNEIARRERIETLNQEIRRPNARQTQHDDEPSQRVAPAATASAARPDAPPRPTRTPRVEALDNRNTFGFRSFGEFAMAVRTASNRGGTVDPRLIANAPSTYSSEGVGADGGFAVPPDFRAEIIKKVMGEDSLLARTDQQTTSSNGFTVPIDETTPWQTSGGVQAYWESEAGQKTQSKIALTEMTTKLNKLISLVPVTDELLQDASSLSSYLRTKAPQKMDFKVTDAIVNGTGVGQPLGFLRSGATIEIAPQSGQAADTIRYDNILDMWSRMYSGCRRNAIWLVNQDVEQQLMRMSFRDQTSDPHPVYLPPGGLADAPYGRLLGRPVIVTEAAPELGDRGDISLIDLSTYLSVTKSGGIRSDVSIHLFFDYDVTAFRFVMRIGGQPWWRAPVSRFNGNNTLSCFVTLGERA